MIAHITDPFNFLCTNDSIYHIIESEWDNSDEYCYFSCYHPDNTGVHKSIVDRLTGLSIFKRSRFRIDGSVKSYVINL